MILALWFLEYFIFLVKKKVIFENTDLHTSIRRDETFCCVNLTSYFKLYKHRAV